jgi:hypothetical protein
MLRSDASNYIYRALDDPTGIDAQWHLVVVTYSGSGTSAGIKMYVDGVQPASYTGSLGTVGDTTSTADMMVGSVYGISWMNAETNFLHSFIINKELTPAEVAELFVTGDPRQLTDISGVLAANIQHWCTLGDGCAIGSGNMIDLSPLSNDGTYTNGDTVDFVPNVPPSPSPLVVQSPLTTSLDYNNDTVNEYTDFQAPPEDWWPGHAYTMGCWIKSTTKPTPEATLISHPRVSFANLGCMLYVWDYSGTGIGARNSYNNSHGSISWWLTSASWGPLIELFDGNWHFVAVTYRGAGYPYSYGSLSTFYVDDISGGLGLAEWPGSGGSGSPTDYSAVGDPVTVGCHTNNSSVPSEFFEGQICHSFIYDRELTREEMFQLWGGGSPRNLLASGAPSGLVHWCTHGDGCAAGAGNMPDLSATGNDGTALNIEGSNPSADVPGAGSYSQKSIYFNGSTQYSNHGDVLAWEWNQAFSVSFWMKASPPVNAYALAKTGPAPTYRGYGAYVLTTGELYFILRNDNATLNYVYVGTTAPHSTGDWIHVVWTYSGSGTAAGLICYVDGSPVALTVQRDTLSGTIVTTDDFTLATWSGLSTLLNGLLDDVAFYDKVLSPAEVTAIFGTGEPNNLSLLASWGNNVGWWKMGDGDTLPTLTDSGNGTSNDGTFVGGTAGDFILDVPPYVSTKSILFSNVSGEVVNLGDVLDHDRLVNRSWSFWFKTSSGEADMLIGKYHPTLGGWYIGKTVSGKINFLMLNTTNKKVWVETVSTGWNDGEWHHCVVVCPQPLSAATMLVYIDDSSEALTQVQNDLVSGGQNNQNLHFGDEGSITGNNPFAGNLDEICAYSGVLSAADVTVLFNQGKLGGPGVPFDPRHAASWANNIGWWRMGDLDTFPTITDNGNGTSNDGTMIGGLTAGDIVEDVPP